MFISFSPYKAILELLSKNGPKNRPFLPKLLLVFWSFWCHKTRFLDFLKVVQELFRKCVGVVTLLLAFKRQLLGAFSARKLNKWTLESNDLSKFWSSDFWGWEGHSGSIFCRKNKISGLFESSTGVVQEVSRHCYWPLKVNFWVYFQLERLINDLWY